MKGDIILNKRYLLEQCKRLQFITKDENIFFENQNDEWWLNHNKGHEYICNEYIKFVESKKILTKKEIIKWMKGKLKESKKVIKSLDEKYIFFTKDDEMVPADNSNYSFNDGILCQVSTLRYIAYIKRYLDKGSYKPTDWND